MSITKATICNILTIFPKTFNDMFNDVNKIYYLLKLPEACNNIKIIFVNI